METSGYSWFNRQGFGGRWTVRSDTDELRLTLLSLLAKPPEAPMQGYHLTKRLEERSGGMYRASAGTVRVGG
jgi:DNA-binding PadR family transcriptional regulator